MLHVILSVYLQNCSVVINGFKKNVVQWAQWGVQPANCTLCICNKKPWKQMLLLHYGSYSCGSGSTL